jgi:hypothetical protein
VSNTPPPKHSRLLLEADAEAAKLQLADSCGSLTTSVRCSGGWWFSVLVLILKIVMLIQVTTKLIWLIHFRDKLQRSLSWGVKFSDTRKEEVRLPGKRRITRGSGGWEFFLLLWLTGLKSSQDEEEPDPQDQAMQGQSLGVCQQITRTCTWERRL